MPSESVSFNEVKMYNSKQLIKLTACVRTAHTLRVDFEVSCDL
ncbi:TPA: hypothetical protein ACFP4P_000379 [Neisseria subflava]